MSFLFRLNGSNNISEMGMAMQNSEILHDLVRNKAIRLGRGKIFDTNLCPKSSSFDFDRIEGMLLGVAIGDALGVTTESMLPANRLSNFGVINHYIPNRYVNEARGFPSDDTQLTFWTLDQIIQDGRFNPENVARKFSNSGRIYGIGSTVRSFLRNYQSDMPWYQCGPESAGNGALMRIAPILIPHLKSGGNNLWVDTALATMITHNDRAAISSCMAFIAILWELLDMNTAPDKNWWLEKYLDVACDLEGETSYTPRCKRFGDYEGSLWKFIDEKISWADDRNMSVLDACNDWYSGAYLLETVPSVLYILMRHSHDPEEAIIRAVNDTKDNDTIAAIVGAAVGALYGKKAFPDRWLTNLSGRTNDRDDGRVFELIDKAKIFCPKG